MLECGMKMLSVNEWKKMCENLKDFSWNFSLFFSNLTFFSRFFSELFIEFWFSTWTSSSATFNRLISRLSSIATVVWIQNFIKNCDTFRIKSLKEFSLFFIPDKNSFRLIKQQRLWMKKVDAFAETNFVLDPVFLRNSFIE